MRPTQPAGSGARDRPSPCDEEHPILMELLVDALETGDVFLDVGADAGYFVLVHAKLVCNEEAGAGVRTGPRRSAAPPGGRASARPDVPDLAVRVGAERRGRLASASCRSGASETDTTTKRSLFNDDGPVVAQVPICVLEKQLVGSGDVELPHGIDAVKIDVELTELRVLTGMRRTIERHRPRVMVIATIERHLNQAGSSVADVDRFLRNLGYGRTNDAHGLELNAVFAPS